MTEATGHRHSEHHAIERMNRSRMERLPVEGLHICKARLNRVEPTRNNIEAGAHGAPRCARRVIGMRKVPYRYANSLRLCDLVQTRHVEISIRILRVRNQPGAQSRLEHTGLRLLQRCLFHHIRQQADKAQRRVESRAYFTHTLNPVDELSGTIECFL